MTILPSQESLLLNIARRAIRGALGENLPDEPTGDDPASNDSLLQFPAGCFVTLHDLDSHRLRGCIGRMQADVPLEQSIREMAVGVLHDPRFTDHPMQLTDLPNLELEISVLSPMELAASPLDFDLPQHGIYLKLGGRTGCFLPQVARETGWSKEQLLARLCTEKMGLSANAWQSGGQLFRFTCQVVGPAPFVAAP